jgi:stage V sporulation protein AB
LFVGFCAGVGVSAGTFAFLLVIHVIPRILQKAKLEKKVIFTENIIIKGILFGTVLSLFEWKKRWLFAILGRMLLTIFGVSAGMFVGCTSIALAEILDTFPIFSRRLKLKENSGLKLIICMAMGKTVGAFLYFYFGYGLLGG